MKEKKMFMFIMFIKVRKLLSNLVPSFPMLGRAVYKLFRLRYVRLRERTEGY
jgi:hypothetical protein